MQHVSDVSHTLSLAPTHHSQGKARLGPAVLRALESYPYLRATPDSPGGAIVVRVRAGQRG